MEAVAPGTGRLERLSAWLRRLGARVREAADEALPQDRAPVPRPAPKPEGGSVRPED